MFLGRGLRAQDLDTDQQLMTLNTMQVFLADERGEPISTIPITPKDPELDLLFRYKIPERSLEYVSWAFEVSQPEKALNYQMAFEGKVPQVLHWDGIFANGSEIAVNQKFYVRLLLVTKTNRILASPWAAFNTTLRSGNEYVKTIPSFIDLFILPSGGTNYMYLSANTGSATVAPNIFGDFRLIYKNEHTMGLGFDVTSNTLFALNALSNGFSYSDLNLFYRYRLMGAPIRPPVVPMLPGFMGSKVKPVLPRDAYGKTTNMEVGVKFNTSTLRGYNGTDLNPGLAKKFQGVSLQYFVDRAVWDLRLHGELSLGYSAFTGKIASIDAAASITYDVLGSFSPGLQFRDLFLTGTSYDEFTGTTNSVANNLMMFGVVVYFKL